MYSENELLFPRSAIPALKKMRGEQWEALINRIARLPDFHEETLALMLMMINLNGCVSCETDSYRAMRGCIACAQQTLRRYKGSDDDLLHLYEKALRDVRSFEMSGHPISRHIATDADSGTLPNVILKDSIEHNAR